MGCFILSATTEIICTILDGKYDKDDYEVLIQLISKSPRYEFHAWDGIDWSGTAGLNRVYDDVNSQHEYDDFIERLLSIVNSKIIFEIAKELEVNQSYFFEKERLYLYIESKNSTG